MNTQRRLVSVLAGIMAAIMLLTLLVGILPVSASAKSSQEIKEEINALKNDRSEILAEMAEEAPVGRNGTPEDVAKAMEYLADADFVTGQVLAVNGGYVM